MFVSGRMLISVYANYIGPSVMTDANCEGFPICDDRITENDRCVIKIIGIHCYIKDINALRILMNFSMYLFRRRKGGVHKCMHMYGST